MNGFQLCQPAFLFMSQLSILLLLLAIIDSCQLAILRLSLLSLFSLHDTGHYSASFHAYRFFTCRQAFSAATPFFRQPILPFLADFRFSLSHYAAFSLAGWPAAGRLWLFLSRPRFLRRFHGRRHCSRFLRHFIAARLFFFITLASHVSSCLISR